MTKELTPLEALRNLTQIAYGSSDDIDDKIKNYFEIIEQSLKDYEMEQSLTTRLEIINCELVEEKQNNEKKLKALEIIKELFKLKISIYEEKDQRPFARVFTVCDDEKCIVYETYLKENIQKLKLVKEVLL